MQLLWQEGERRIENIIIVVGGEGLNWKIQEKGRKKVDKEAKIYRKETNPIAINTDKWQNKGEVKTDDKSKIEKGGL